MSCNIDKNRFRLLSSNTGSGDACAKCHNEIGIDLPARDKPQFFLNGPMHERSAGGAPDKHHLGNIARQKARVLQRVMNAIQSFLQIRPNHLLIVVATDFSFEMEIVVDEFFTYFDKGSSLSWHFARSRITLRR